ncbi:hypothetical protein UlMin_036683 [Ulmus minor]
MYEGFVINVHLIDGMSSEFPILVRLHQGLALSPYLFALVMDELTKHLQVENGAIREDIDHKIKVGWMKWRMTSGVLCDRRMSARLKEKWYKTIVQPSMLYDSECWDTMRQHTHKLVVIEMRNVDPFPFLFFPMKVSSSTYNPSQLSRCRWKNSTIEFIVFEATGNLLDLLDREIIYEHEVHDIGGCQPKDL